MPGTMSIDQQTLSIAGMFAVARRYWLLVVACTLVFAVAAVVVAIRSKPVFRAEVVSVPVDGEEAGGLQGLADQLGGLGAFAGIALGGGGQNSEHVAILKSRALARGLIEEANLMPILFADRWDEGNRAWIDDGSPAPTLHKAQEKFRSDVASVLEDRTGGTVIVRVEWTDPELAAEWAAALLARANAVAKARAIQEAQASIDFLQERLQVTQSLEVRQAIYRLMESHLKQMVVASGRREYAFRTVDPARASDRDDFVRPKRKLLVAVGLCVGFSVGLVLAFWLTSVAGRRRSSEAGR
jgi:uncharacterized protein involved in exopolysaccharide biosynthesis